MKETGRQEWRDLLSPKNRTEVLPHLLSSSRQPLTPLTARPSSSWRLEDISPPDSRVPDIVEPPLSLLSSQRPKRSPRPQRRGRHAQDDVG